MSDLSKQFVLVLNAYYVPIGTTSIRKALTNLFSTNDGENMASLAFDLDYPLNDDGSLNYKEPWVREAVSIERWLELPVRDWDVPVHTAKKAIRAPIVLLAKNYTKLAMRELPLNLKNAWLHYGKKDVWSGEEISLDEASLEHWVPRADGGQHSWENVVIASKKNNSLRGRTPVSKLKPNYRPRKPLPRTAASTIVEIPRPEWGYFLMRNK